MTNRIRPLDIPLAAIEWIDAHRVPAERTGVELVRQLDDHFDTVIELVAAAGELIHLERSQGVTDEEHEAAVERLDAALAAFN